MLKSEVLLSLTIALVTGCSQLSDMSQMKDTTQHMANTTDGMAATTAGMATTTSQMASTTDGMAATTNGMAVTTNDVLAQTSDMYQDLRQGNSVTIRNQVLKDMNQATSMQKKIDEAGVYFQAFEFQLWKGDARDTQDTLEGLYDCAMMEFTRILHDYLPNDLSKVNVESTTDAKLENLYALAVTMHQVNPNAQAGALSMFDLVKNILQVKADVDSGKLQQSDLQAWQQEGLLNYQELVYMVQIRTNFLPVMTLAQISSIATANDLEKLKMVMLHWDSDFSNVNPVQLTTYISWMNEADADAAFLESLKLPVKADSKVQKIFRNMDITNSAEASMSASTKSLIDPELQSFKSSYEAYDAITQ